jgi:type VI secretion system secreted protein VgrG
MPTMPPPRAPSPVVDPVTTRVSNLERRLAALEAIISQSGGNVTIAAPGGLRIQTGAALAISCGSDLSIACARGLAVSTGHNLSVTAGGLATFMSGAATFTMRSSGEVDVAGTKISVRGSGDLTLRGSRILHN